MKERNRLSLSFWPLSPIHCLTLHIFSDLGYKSCQLYQKHSKSTMAKKLLLSKCFKASYAHQIYQPECEDISGDEVDMTDVTIITKPLKYNGIFFGNIKTAVRLPSPSDNNAAKIIVIKHEPRGGGDICEMDLGAVAVKQEQFEQEQNAVESFHKRGMTVKEEPVEQTDSVGSTETVMEADDAKNNRDEKLLLEWNEPEQRGPGSLEATGSHGLLQRLSRSSLPIATSTSLPISTSTSLPISTSTSLPSTGPPQKSPPATEPERLMADLSDAQTEIISKMKTVKFKLLAGKPVDLSTKKVNFRRPKNLLQEQHNCNQCTRKYWKKSKLLEHLRNHHGGKAGSQGEGGSSKLRKMPSAQ